MKELMEVRVEDAPGYEDFYGLLYDTFAGVDSRGDLAIVIDYSNEIIVVPLWSVTYITST